MLAHIGIHGVCFVVHNPKVVDSGLRRHNDVAQLWRISISRQLI
jgi:hypothetical protein